MKLSFSFHGAPRRLRGIGQPAIICVLFASLLVGCGGAPAAGQCSDGAAQPCACPDATQSQSHCRGGTWAACECMTSPPPDMAPACTGQLDELKQCCHGDDCCDAANHSQASGGTCVCETGYVPGPNFSSTNRVCVASKPDLEVTGWQLWRQIPSSSPGLMWICLNKRPDNTYAPTGDFVEVKNTGNGASTTYHVALGIQSVYTADYFYCPLELHDDTGLAPGETGRWAGPFCCNFTVTKPGTYELFAYADANAEVMESNEDNNYLMGGASFDIH